MDFNFDFYSIALQKRFKLLERRIKRAEEEMYILKSSFINKHKADHFDRIKKTVQLDLFAG